jgi:PAS domain S-box-containing protein
VDNYISYLSVEKALEQEKRAEAKYRGIFENAAEGIVQVSGDGGILSCNPAAAAILDYGSAEEMIESVTDFERQLFVKPELGKEMSERLRQGLKVNHLEVEFYRKDGSRQWVQLSVCPVLNEEGEVLTLDCMILDIAERKRAEMALQHLNEELEQRVTIRTGELEQANLGLHTLTEELETAFRELKSAQSRILQQEKMASIGQLAAGVAHEINNPMGFIISNLNSFSKYTGKITTFMQIQAEAVKTLEEDCCASAVVENLQKQKKLLKLDYVMEDLNLLIGESMEGAERIKRIVQNLKSFSRLDDTEFKMTEINAGIESTINIVWNEIRHKAVLNKELGDIPAIYCNLGQLNQVFMNLLVNAAQAMDSQGEITVKTSRDDKNVYIAVSDTGKGIPEDKLNRIFEPFFTTKEVGQGTGLGLSIAYDIVRQHHGVIHVESEVGKGTTFTISLPIADPMAAQA